MFDDNLDYHIIEERDGEYIPKISFETYEDAEEFFSFLSNRFFIVEKEKLEEYLEFK